MSLNSVPSLNSFLAARLQAYMDFKQKLGYTSFQRMSAARELDYYLLFRSLRSAKEIDESFVANWIHSIPTLSARTKNRKLAFIRGFLRYLIRIGEIRENPALRIPNLKERPYKPYIYSLKEIGQILEKTGKYKDKYPHRLLGWTLETIFFLLYACGLRLGEALNLKIRDIDFDENTLSLWNTKFHKERLVPFSETVAQKLKSYLQLRRRFYPPTSSADPFFCHTRGKYINLTIQTHFRNVLVRCGMAKPKGRGPRLHDLRHAFAVHRLYKWYQEGHDILNKLPLLSTYMGHVNIEATQVYLTITRALLREGDRRFQGAFEDITENALKRVFKKL